MTVAKLHEITGQILARKQGHIEVAIDYATFPEDENGTILPIDGSAFLSVQGVDDSGPVGRRFPMLVLRGGHHAD